MAKSPKKQREQSSISIAVDFLKHCEIPASAGNESYAAHVLFINGYVYRFDGIVAAAYPCQDEIDICPEFEPFNKGLKRVGSSFQIQVAEKELRIVGEKLQVHCYAIAKDEYLALPPDQPIYAVDNEKFRKSLAKIAKIPSDSGEHVLTSSFRFRANTATATNRHLIAQVITGTHTDVDLIIPKRTITTLLKTTMPIVSIGYSDTSVTFWFENGAFMRSQLYNEPWSDKADALLVDNKEEHTNIPREFFEAVATVADLGETNAVYLTEKGVQDLPNDKIATTYKIAYKDHPCYISAELLALVADHAGKCMINNTLPSGARVATFFGDDYRATIAHMLPKRGEAQE